MPNASVLRGQVINVNVPSASGLVKCGDDVWLECNPEVMSGKLRHSILGSRITVPTASHMMRLPRELTDIADDNGNVSSDVKLWERETWYVKRWADSRRVGVQQLRVPVALRISATRALTKDEPDSKRGMAVLAGKWMLSKSTLPAGSVSTPTGQQHAGGVGGRRSGADEVGAEDDSVCNFDEVRLEQEGFALGLDRAPREAAERMLAGGAAGVVLQSTSGDEAPHDSLWRCHIISVIASKEPTTDNVLLYRASAHLKESRKRRQDNCNIAYRLREEMQGIAQVRARTACGSCEVGAALTHECTGRASAQCGQ